LATGEQLEYLDEGGYWRVRFQAMASPCELLLDEADEATASQLLPIAADEARRIEQKFSRYRSDSIVHQINQSHGRPVAVDAETARLLDYAESCYQLSEGLFDITAGVLRRAWSFDPGATLPQQQQLDSLLKQIGWSQVVWNGETITLPTGMEIDLGGIGKEYAVDRTAQLIAARFSGSFLLNFGGDLFVSAPRSDGSQWQVAIDDPASTAQQSLLNITLAHGAIATSGDAHRHISHDGRRYSHILNPKTGWPVEGAPRSVTVAANSCMEAGILATFAMLQGKSAKTFLQREAAQHWVVD